jgi:uncharacterized protein YycO
MAISVKKFPQKPAQAYKKIRNQIKTGDILLCSGSGLFSKLIQGASKSVWSHVAFIIRLDSIDRVMVLESVEPLGVRTVPLSHYVRDYKGDGRGYPGRLLIARHKQFGSLPPARLHKMSQFAVDLFGYPYDKDEIVKIAARIGKSFFGLSTGAVKRDKEYICSEYAWECYNKVGIKIKYDPRGFVAPKDFAAAKDIEAFSVLKTEK